MEYDGENCFCEEAHYSKLEIGCIPCSVGCKDCEYEVDDYEEYCLECYPDYILLKKRCYACDKFEGFSDIFDFEF